MQLVQLLNGLKIMDAIFAQLQVEPKLVALVGHTSIQGLVGPCSHSKSVFFYFHHLEITLRWSHILKQRGTSVESHLVKVPKG